MFCHLSGKKLSVCVHMCVTLGDAAEQLGKRGQEWSRGPPAVDRWRWKEQSRFNLDRGRTMVDHGAGHRKWSAAAFCATGASPKKAIMNE